jgi:nucleoside-diphosphate kinase
MERSLVLIKPDAVERNIAGVIINRFEQHGLKIVALKMLRMDETLAKRHYAIHQGKPFFDSLVKHITSSPVIAIVFEGEKAVELIRKIVGATDPAKSERGTIRADFGISIPDNAVHSSDSPEDAAKEIGLFFTEKETFNY